MTPAQWLARWPIAGQRFCRWCRARPGEPCITVDGEQAARPHVDRRRRL